MTKQTPLNQTIAAAKPAGTEDHLTNPFTMKHTYKFKNWLRPAWLLFCGLMLTGWPTNVLRAHVAEGRDYPDCSITLHVDNQEVKNVLAKIQQQCDVRFTYSSTVIPATRKVSLSVTNQRLDQVLSEFLPTCNIDYRIENRQIILFKAEKSGYAPVEAVPALAPVIEMMRISGRITDGNGEGLPGVTIRVKDTNVGTSTDGNGNFTLETPENSGTLVLSYTGYVSQEVPFNETTRTLNLVMQTDEQALSEVIVIGYQTVRKRDLTGAASVVDIRESRKIAATSLQETLQGLSSGVAVSNSGRPGDMPRVNIRGLSSFSGDSRPLYVVDGLLVDADANFNMNDVESVQILKDASAAAIFGSRAANGVIIITTKKGQEGALKLGADVKLGTQSFWKTRDLMDANEFASFSRNLYQNVNQAPLPSVSTKFDPNVNTDWQDAAFRPGYMQDYSLTASGGSKQVRYLISGNYFKNQGAVIGSAFERKSARINTDATLGRVTLGTFLNFADTRQDQQATNPFIDAIRMLPVIPVQGEEFINRRNPAGYGVGLDDYQTFGTNPVARTFSESRVQNRFNIRALVFAELRIFDWLRYRYNFGMDRSFEAFRYRNRGNAWDRNSHLTDFQFPVLTQNRAEYQAYTQEHLLNFNHNFGTRHRLDGVVGYTQITRQYSRIGFGRDGLYAVNAATGTFLEELNSASGNVTGQEGFSEKSALLGLLSRVNYAFDDKYLLSVTFRRDGDSRFGQFNRYANFPSVAAAWRISKEGFLSNISAISELKLRGSYGVLGNADVLGYYETQSFVNFLPRAILGNGQAEVVGATRSALAPGDLKWEEKKTLNFGFDLSLFKNRISLTADWFRSDINDLLFRLPLPLSLGTRENAPNVNSASMRNRGIEFDLTYRGGGGKFRYSIGLNATHIQNEVVRTGFLSNGEPVPQIIGVTRAYPGYSIGEYYLIKTDGIFQTQAEVNAYTNADGGLVQPNARPGDLKFQDFDGNGQINLNDRQYVGSPWPDLAGGVQLAASYGAFSLSMQWYGVTGNQIFNDAKYWLYNPNENHNYLSGTQPWTPQQPTETPRLTYNRSDAPGNRGMLDNGIFESDRWLEDGSYLRLRHIELAYTLPESLVRRLRSDNMRIAISGQNLFTFTNYSGLDPDVRNTNNFEFGRDVDTYPALRTFTASISVGF